jgi:hypothetical protein
MFRPEVSPEENVLRAIHSAWWDVETDQKSSSIFKGERISLNRLKMLDLRSSLNVFHETLDTSPNGVIIGAGEINVGTLIEIAQAHHVSVVLTVEEDPLPGNPAHAEIPQKISKGLANKIIEKLIFHRDESYLNQDKRS